jgi:acetyl esterase/lipase
MVRTQLPNSKPIVLMGDSAGGGLALAIAQRDWKFVSKLILISPWVDSEFADETKMYEKRDPWLSASSLRYIATVWSGVKSVHCDTACKDCHQLVYMLVITNCSIRMW